MLLTLVLILETELLEQPAYSESARILEIDDCIGMAHQERESVDRSAISAAARSTGDCKKGALLTCQLASRHFEGKVSVGYRS